VQLIVTGLEPAVQLHCGNPPAKLPGALQLHHHCNWQNFCFNTCLQDEEELYDAIVDQWVSARSATLEQQVAGLRLLLACLDCWLFQYPLTEEALVEKLGHWAVGGLDKAAVLGDEPPSTLQALQEEARQTYAMGAS
jgi:HIV-1 Vpr-binding protein